MTRSDIAGATRSRTRHAAGPVPVMSEEDEVALVVQGDRPPTPELRVVREERGEHAADAVPEPRVEVVEDHLGKVRRALPAVLGAGAIIITTIIIISAEMTVFNVAGCLIEERRRRPTNYFLHNIPSKLNFFKERRVRMRKPRRLPGRTKLVLNKRQVAVCKDLLDFSTLGLECGSGLEVREGVEL